MLLTKAEAAERLRVHPDTVGRMIKDGRLKATKAPGRAGHIRISEEDLADYLAKTRVQVTT